MQNGSIAPAKAAGEAKSPVWEGSGRTPKEAVSRPKVTLMEDNTAAAALAELRTLLATVPAGAVSRGAAPRIIGKLQACWGEFSGWDQQSTWAYKLARAEDVKWNPPLLEFKLERHGATVQGSTRAELHAWSVDINQALAEVGPAGSRQLYPMDAPFREKDALELARELRDLIAAGRPDERLKWYPNGDVAVILKASVQASNNQTRVARQRRFKGQLLPVLREAGWNLTGRGSLYRFSRTAPDGRREATSSGESSVG